MTQQCFCRRKQSFPPPGRCLGDTMYIIKVVVVLSLWASEAMLSIAEGEPWTDEGWTRVPSKNHER